MKRPIPLWSCYLALVLLSALGLVGISYYSMRWVSDRQVSLQEERKALKEARQARVALLRQQEISEGLWYADSILGPILANETEQPWQNFAPVWDSLRNQPAEIPSTEVPAGELPIHLHLSPLLLQPSAFAWLHFQIDQADRWTSPQVPPAFVEPTLKQLGWEDSQSLTYHTRMTQLQTSLSRRELAALIPANFRSNLMAIENSANLRNRAQVISAYAANSSFQQQYNGLRNDDEQRASQAALPPVIENKTLPQLPEPSHAVWHEGRLLLIKRVNHPSMDGFLGCWLDWDRLNSWLTEQLSETCPGVRFEPVHSSDKRTPTPQQLANLPVRMIWERPVEVPLEEGLLPTDDGGLRVLWLPLSVAWISWLLGSLGGALLLSGLWNLSQRRATFVSAVTHELRTPLTTFRLYTDLLLNRKDLSEAQRDNYLKTLSSQSDRITRLVENVLTFAGLEGNRKGPAVREVRVGELFSSTEPRLLQLAGRYRAEIESELCPETQNQRVLMNEDLFEQMLTNLVENAMKYGLTDTNRCVGIQAVTQDKHVVIDVIDHGPGIAPEFRSKLFQPFSRSAEQAAGKSPGIGLGLSITQRMARQMRGELKWVRSDSGETRFRLTFPCLRAEHGCGT